MKKPVLIALALALAGCNPEQALDTLDAQMCTARGEKARDTYRALRHDDYLATDRAVCVRCPGERALTCTGEPVALPVE